MSSPRERILAEDRKREFTRRYWIVLASWAPLAVAFAVLVDDWTRETSLLSFIPPLRAMTDLQWIVVWGAILLACAVFHAIVARIWFRCTACERFIGRDWDSRHCPHCGTRLQDGPVPDER